MGAEITRTSLLIIGGTGFFGKSILDAWQRGLLAPWGVDRIIAMARDTSVLARDVPHLLDDHVELIDGDIGTAATLPAADYVIHAASSADASRYTDFPAEERANILRAIDNYAVLAATVHRNSKIVYASSGAVYGQQPSDLEALPEDYLPGEVTGMVAYKRAYAEAKRLAEQRIAALGRDHSLRVSVARCFAFVGAYLPRDRHFAIGNFLADGQCGRPIDVRARHAVIRSYMHADDLVRWLMTIADHADPSCPIYNVGSDQAIAIGDVARLVAANFAVEARVPSIAGDEIDRYVPSIDRARRDLGLALEFPLDAALADVAARL